MCEISTEQDVHAPRAGTHLVLADHRDQLVDQLAIHNQMFIQYVRVLHTGNHAVAAVVSHTARPGTHEAPRTDASTSVKQLVSRDSSIEWLGKAKNRSTSTRNASCVDSTSHSREIGQAARNDWQLTLDTTALLVKAWPARTKASSTCATASL